ncbi:hypothetical protein V1264_009665 [Littorina saxatilis]|uniref:Uncharacterized protein n=1 Tax=Littorina saxatilis TaxID=31220 RepID=A0AAN9G221_9CAEN
MPPRRKLNEFERGRAVAWFQDCVPKREVARRLHVSISVIVRLMQRFTATGRFRKDADLGDQRRQLHVKIVSLND